MKRLSLIAWQVAAFAGIAFAMGCERREGTPGVDPTIGPTPGELAPDGAGDDRAEARGAERDPSATLAAGSVRSAQAALQTAPGTELEGQAAFRDTPTGVQVVLQVSNAKPGLHGVHIHQRGDCSDIPGKSMGDHFDPKGQPHGLPGKENRHPGDLGNIVVGQDGRGRLEVTTPAGTLREDGDMSFLNRAIVVHEGADTGAQPSGDAGVPVACGVIRAAK